MSRPSFVVVLPARYGSTRFPGKPLAPVAGRPLIEWVWRHAMRVAGAERVVVATDDRRIESVVRGFGGDVVMTRANHATGTDRVAEVASTLDCDVVVNLQGDEPVFDSHLVPRLVDLLAAHDEFDIATACHPCDDAAALASTHVVKVVRRRNGEALYFSRAPIPAGASALSASDVADAGDGQRDAAALALRHIGVYAYRREALLRLSALPRSPLECREKLEQLRALEHGMRIGVIVTGKATIGVDVPADVKSVEKVLDPNYTGRV